MSSPRESTGRSALAALVALVVSFALLRGFASAYEVPVPRTHDEFAYLLTGDTFAQGRLANATHPHWLHFESFHVIHQPTYQGKYPPGQGAFLALGEVLGGEPALGVWISFALACAALVWMLCAVVPASWAWLASILFLFNTRAFLEWGQSYWGGAVAMLGGALLFGGLLRVRARVSLLDGLAMALGLLVLANTRPYEGALVGGAACLVALPWIRGGWASGEGRAIRTKLGLPVLLACVAIAGWTLYYNARLTGDPLRFPHEHWISWQARAELIRTYTGSPALSVPVTIRRLVGFFLGYTLIGALPFLALRRPKAHVVFAALLVLGLGVVSVAFTRAWPHYLAPVAPLVLLLIVEGLRSLARVRIGGLRVGAWAAGALVVAHVAYGAHLGADRIRRGPPRDWAHQRQEQLESLEQRGGHHLVLIAYPAGHGNHEDWVSNAADIDSAPVVWARHVGPEEDAALLRHFADRAVWELEFDGQERRLVPLEARQSASPSGH